MNPALRDAAKEYLVRYGGDAFPNLFVAAKGTIVRDDTGREILDFTSGQMCATVGHNHPAIVAAVHAAGTKAFHLFSGMIPEVVAELGQTLAQRLDARRPDQIAVRQHRLRKQRGGAAHGQAAHRRLRGARGWRLLARHHRRHQRRILRQRPQRLRRARARRVRDAGTERLPPLHQGRRRNESALACLELGLKMFDMQSSGRPAAIIIEPIISAGGVLVPPKAYMQALRRAADERGMLLIFDEAQTAFGRIGHRTGSEFFGVVPDIMSVSKTLGGGLPLAGDDHHARRSRTASTARASTTTPATYPIPWAPRSVWPCCASSPRNTWSNGRARSAAICAGGCKNCSSATRRSATYAARACCWASNWCRTANRASRTTSLAPARRRKCFDMGLSMNIRRRPERGSVWRIAPPLTVSTDEIDRAVAILDQALRESLDEMAIARAA